MSNSSGKCVIDFPSPHEFLKLYFMVEAKSYSITSCGTQCM